MFYTCWIVGAIIPEENVSLSTGSYYILELKLETPTSNKLPRTIVYPVDRLNLYHDASAALFCALIIGGISIHHRQLHPA